MKTFESCQTFESKQTLRLTETMHFSINVKDEVWNKQVIWLDVFRFTRYAPVCAHADTAIIPMIFIWFVIYRYEQGRLKSDLLSSISTICSRAVSSIVRKSRSIYQLNVLSRWSQRIICILRETLLVLKSPNINQPNGRNRLNRLIICTRKANSIRLRNQLLVRIDRNNFETQHWHFD